MSCWSVGSNFEKLNFPCHLDPWIPSTITPSLHSSRSRTLFPSPTITKMPRRGAIPTTQPLSPRTPLAHSLDVAVLHVERKQVGPRLGAAECDSIYLVPRCAGARALSLT